MAKPPAEMVIPGELPRFPPTEGCSGCRDPHRYHHSKKCQELRRKFGMVAKGSTADEPPAKRPTPTTSVSSSGNPSGSSSYKDSGPFEQKSSTSSDMEVENPVHGENP